MNGKLDLSACRNKKAGGKKAKGGTDAAEKKAKVRTRFDPSHAAVSTSVHQGVLSSPPVLKELLQQNTSSKENGL